MIAIDRKIEINNLTIGILENVDMLDKVPIDIVKVANSLGVKVYNCEFERQGTSGAITNENGKYSIYVKADDAKVTQRYMVAHEIGHFVLHKKDIKDVHYDDVLLRGKFSNDMDEEANYFASCLLMNEEALLKICNLLDDKNRLAKIFEVSERVMKNRLRETG